jgi:hypothetical protein
MSGKREVDGVDTISGGDDGDESGRRALTEC